MSKTDFEPLQNAVEAYEKLYSIFDRVSLGNTDGRLNNQHNRRVLRADNIVDGTETSPSTAKIELQKDLDFLKNLDENAQRDTFFYILQKHGWRIRNPKKSDGEDFDVAFCDAHRVEKALENHDNFVLVKGDLTGIQKYIYGNIQSKQAGGLVNLSKKLRGRSVIVSLLTDFLANVILRELGLPMWHLLFAGGGHFNLLIPDVKKTELNERIKELNAEMRRLFGYNLQLAFAQLDVSKNEIEQNPSIHFSRLNFELERQKMQPLRGQLLKHFQKSENKPAIDADAEIKIGKDFPKQNLLVEIFSAQNIRAKHVSELFSLKLKSGFYSLFAAKDLDDVENLLLGSKNSDLKSAQILWLNNTEFFPSLEQNWDYENWRNVAFGFRFLGKFVPNGEYPHPKTKVKENRPKTFEEIVEGDQLNMLAALRLDVDDLGFIFSKGIKKPTLGEIVCLSREMQYFFSAHFDLLAENHDQYLVYSGGDDAFCVGKWDKTIDFTRKLHSDFQKFVFDSPDVHFSAGIFMGDPYFPIGRFSGDAAALLEVSKNSSTRKNQVNIFNHTLAWEEFHSKLDLGETFFKALNGVEKNGKKLNSAFVYRILNLVKSSFYERSGLDKNSKRYRRGSINVDRFSRNVAGLRYLFARNGMDAKRAEEQVSEIEKALIGDFLKSFDFGGSDDRLKTIRDYLVSLNYALFKHRAQLPDNNS